MRRGEQVVVYLCTVLLSVGAITVQTPQKVVEAARGKSATLKCQYQTTVTDFTGSSIWWKKVPDDAVAIAYLGNRNQSDDQYKDRVSFTGNFKTNDATIVINQLVMEDNGTYQCEVQIPEDFKGSRSAKMDLVVLGRDREEGEEEEVPEHRPQPKKQMPPQQEQQYYQDDEDDDDDLEDNPPRKPPMLPTNKPRLVINSEDA
ncbi:cell surface A33 antigen [Anomaloglossus baeobatrachus]|uniref:cell surface A33 antigen n=1 Tax=Anomaloglossus baeobatrachus TaxID=238106 RepID=UPI003F50616C